MTDDGAPGDASTEAEPIEPDERALSLDELRYPEFVFDEDGVGDDGRIDLERELDYEEMGEWLDELAGGLGSHDVAVTAADGHTTFGVAPDTASVSFDPDENGRGKLEFTFTMNAKVMFHAENPDLPKTGARGGRGFIPIEMLTSDREPDQFRCYNWMNDAFED